MTFCPFPWLQLLVLGGTVTQGKGNSQLNSILDLVLNQPESRLSSDVLGTAMMGAWKSSPSHCSLKIEAVQAHKTKWWISLITCMFWIKLCLTYLGCMLVKVTLGWLFCKWKKFCMAICFTTSPDYWMVSDFYRQSIFRGFFPSFHSKKELKITTVQGSATGDSEIELSLFHKK